jgi:hypothetical protein
VNGLPGLKNRGRALASGLLLAAVATPAVVTAVAAAAPAAQAAPVAAAAPAAQAAPVAAAAPAAAAARADAAAPIAVTASTAPTPPGEVTWSAVGATPKGPNGRYEFSYNNIKPGSTIKDWVELFNRGTGSAAFQVYGADAVGTTIGNSITYDEVGVKPTDIGSWATFYNSASLPNAPQASFVMPGGHGIIEPFTISVPLTATPGDHTGGLMVQVGVPRVNAQGEHVTVYSRIALPILLRVVGPLKTGLQIESVSTGFSVPLNPFGTGSATISYSVTNTGNLRISGAQLVKVSGAFGTSTVIPVHLPTILPGDSIRISTAAPGLYPAGPMTATVTVTPNWPKSEIPASLTLTTVSASASLFAVPWTLLGLIVLLAAIGYGVWWVLRWRRRLHAADLAAVAEKVRKETERRVRSEAKTPAAATTAAATSSAAGSGGDASGTGDDAPKNTSDPA